MSSTPRPRAVVFGGSGFIGTRLCKHLVAQGHDVTVADVLPLRPYAPPVTYVRCDVRHPITLPTDEPFDAVFNLAAVHRTPGHEPWEYYDTNVNAALNVTEWCAAGASDYICFTSSISVYGPTETPKSELDELSPTSDYGRSKVIAERIHRGWVNGAAARRLTIIRPAAVFGPGEHGNFTRLAKALRTGRFMYAGRTDVIKACGYVDDLVRAMTFAAQLPMREIVFNYCYPKPSDIREICQAFRDVAGYRMPRTIPKAALASGIRLLRAVNPHNTGTISAARIAKLTASTNVVPLALHDLGFEWQTDLLEGLREWYRDPDTVGFDE